MAPGGRRGRALHLINCLQTDSVKHVCTFTHSQAYRPVRAHDESPRLPHQRAAARVHPQGTSRRRFLLTLTRGGPGTQAGLGLRDSAGGGFTVEGRGCGWPGTRLLLFPVRPERCPRTAHERCEIAALVRRLKRSRRAVCRDTRVMTRALPAVSWRGAADKMRDKMTCKMPCSHPHAALGPPCLGFRV